jgi:hypothetical protein
MVTTSHRTGHSRSVGLAARDDPTAEMRLVQMGMCCLRLHSEMALQTSRALESADHSKASGSRGRDPWGPPATGWGHSSSVGSAARDEPTEEIRPCRGSDLWGPPATGWGHSSTLDQPSTIQVFKHNYLRFAAQPLFRISPLSLSLGGVKSAAAKGGR